MLKVSFRNIFRNKRRTIITFILISVGSIIFSIFRFVSFGVHQDMIWHVVELNTGFIQIAANGWLENPVIERAMDTTPELIQELKNMEKIHAVAPRIAGHGLISYRENSRFISVLGIDALQEKKITTIHKRITEGSYLNPESDKHQGIIGYKLARHLGVSPGDTVYIIGSQFDGSMRVLSVEISGIYKAVDVELDMSRIIINLQAARQLFSPDDPESQIKRYTSIALGVEHYRDAEDVYGRLSEKFPIPELEKDEDRENSENYDPVALFWEDLNPGIVQMVILDEIQNDLFYGFLLIIIAFGVLNNVQMSIHERNRELGILLALGTRPRDLVAMILLETLIIMIPSLIIGNAVGTGICYYWYLNPIVLGGDFGQMYIDMGFEPILRPILDTFQLWVSILSIFVPSMTLALIASRRVFKLNPVQIIGTL
ncbi:MAG: FtsX-like permease family protein [Spirochaetia bacterium]|nr:FtsX-like permease family protein [Spirochaetia bacterium]